VSQAAEQRADDAVDLLIERYGVEEAERRLLYCLSQVRRRMVDSVGEA